MIRTVSAWVFLGVAFLANALALAHHAQPIELEQLTLHAAVAFALVGALATARRNR